VVACLLTAMSLLAFLGLQCLVRMLPILLFEVTWKVIWIAGGCPSLPHLVAGRPQRRHRQGAVQLFLRPVARGCRTLTSGAPNATRPPPWPVIVRCDGDLDAALLPSLSSLVVDQVVDADTVRYMRARPTTAQAACRQYGPRHDGCISGTSRS
jgi:hypothetical protein